MENISHSQWKPSEAERTYLQWELRSMGNGIMNMPDAFVCGQLFNAYKAHYGVTPPNVPALDYLLHITQEYRHSLNSTPATSFDLTPSFISQNLSDPTLGISLFGGYIDPLQHNPIPPGTLNNTPVQLNNSMLDFNQQAGPSYPGYFLPNMPPDPRDQMREAHHQSPTISGPSNKENPDDVIADVATIERTEPVISQYLAKSGGRHAEKNMFYPNKTTASTLYGKSIPEATAEVDERIRLKPSLQGQRVKLINEERTNRWNSLTKDEQQLWVDKARELNDQPPDFGTLQQKYKLLKTKIQAVHQHADEAFALSVVSMIFLPADRYEKPRATIFDCHSDGRQSFTEWLKATHGSKVLANFLSYVDGFAETLGVSVKQPDDNGNDNDNNDNDNGSDAAKVISKVAKANPVWRDGIHYVSDPNGKGMTAGPLRVAARTGVYDRWLACGWFDKKMPWTRVEDMPENFIQPKLLKEGLSVKFPEKQDIASLRTLVQFFFDHQNGDIPYQEGLLFMPCGSGSKLHYATKRPKGAKTRKNRGTGANQDAPDTDKEFPSPSPSPAPSSAPSPAPSPMALPDTTPSAATTPHDSETVAITPSPTVGPPIPAAAMPPPPTMMVSLPTTQPALPAGTHTDTTKVPTTLPTEVPNTTTAANAAPPTANIASTTTDPKKLPTISFKQVAMRKAKSAKPTAPSAVPTTVRTKLPEATTSLPPVLAPVAAKGPAIATPVPSAISIANANAAPTVDSAATESTAAMAITAEDSATSTATAAANTTTTSSLIGNIPDTNATSAATITTDANPVTANAPVKEKKKAGRKPKATTVASTAPPTNTHVPTSTDTTAMAPANLTPSGPANNLPNNAATAAPRRTTRQKRNAKNAGMDDSETSASTRKSQRLA